MLKQSKFQLADNVAIVVGRGLLPCELVEGMIAQGRTPLLIGLEGEKEAWLDNYPHEMFVWGQLGRFFKHLKKHNIKQVLFAGGVTRPKLKLRNMDMGGILSLTRVMTFMIGGDNSLLSGLIKLFDSHGIEVIGPHQVLPELLAQSGTIAGRKPSGAALNNINKAFDACKKLGELDIGQAAVAVGGRVIALEGIEGTDGMLERVASMRESGRLYESGKHGVLVKTMKPDQDMRADLPAIGPRTIEMIEKAGLKGIAIEAGYSLILSRSETISAAKKAGVFIYGFTAQSTNAS